MSYYRTIYRAARRSVQWGATLCGVLVVTLGCVTVSAAAEGTGAADRVATHEGLLEGPGPDAAGVRRFLGVPYAQAPVGLLRWAAPQPAQHWMGTRLASRFGPRCMQLPVFSDMVFRSDGMSEDCLYLNVWTPARDASARLPVLVYFYGGGFIGGDGSEPRYDGGHLARRGLVVVTLNYRLGVFGFLAHPALSAEASYHGSGNYGLLDQRAALGWVRENIAAFGGDPERVTLAGESAGSVAVSAHMVSPLSRGLFAGAIGESGSLLRTLAAVPLTEAEQTGTRLAQQAGVATIGELRAVSAARLLELAGKPGFGRKPAGTATPKPFDFPITVDGYYLPAPPAALYAAGKAASVPLLAGVNSGEGQPDNVLGHSPATLSAYRSALSEKYGARADEFLAVYSAGSDGEPVLKASQALASDTFIGYSTWHWVDSVTRTGSKPTYFYEFTRARPPMTAQGASAAATAAAAAAALEPVSEARPPRGAVHSTEIEYALDNLDGNLVYEWSQEDRQVAALMSDYVAQFVKHGDPNGKGLPLWPRYRTGRQMILDVTPRSEPVTALGRYRFLERFYSATPVP